MTEIELSLSLGIALEPIRNKVQKYPLLISQINYMKNVFLISKEQTLDIGRVDTNLLVPFISDN
jgi:hypothetical protein